MGATAPGLVSARDSPLPSCLPFRGLWAPPASAGGCMRVGHCREQRPGEDPPLLPPPPGQAEGPFLLRRSLGALTVSC